VSASAADRLARVALGRLAEPGDPRLASVVASLGAEEVHQRLAQERDVTGLATDVASRLSGLDPAAELERAGKQGIRFVCPDDDEWPARLADLDHAPGLNQRGGAPLGLWVKGTGRLDDLSHRALSVVGSRSATTYGAAVAGEIAAHVAAAGVTVVSGAAFGIDQAGHRGALSAGRPTVAVLACGADRAYPAAHRDLLDYIAESGGLVVSEVPPGCAPTKHRFLSRNRVIAAISLGTVVVEAALRSGALNTANWATLVNRVVMGVPGPVTSAPSEGVHELIRTRGAALVTRGSDVLELISPAGDSALPFRRGAERAHDRLNETDQRVLDAVPVTVGVTRASIARTAGLAGETVGDALSRLAEGGFVERSGEGWRLAGAGMPVSGG
jgi:DNA processing protein